MTHTAKSILELICSSILKHPSSESQTTHDVDPKDVKTTKPSSGVSWRFLVQEGTEFPYVQLSSISRPNLDLLEKAVERGGVQVVWLNDAVRAHPILLNVHYLS